MCGNFFSCSNRFKKPDCENFHRDWGYCKDCDRIVSPRHSNCPGCGSRNIEPILAKERAQEIQERKEHG